MKKLTFLLSKIREWVKHGYSSRALMAHVFIRFAQMDCALIIQTLMRQLSRGELIDNFIFLAL